MKRKNMAYARSPRWCWLVAAIAAVTVLPSSGPSAAENTENAETAIRVAQYTGNAQSTSGSTSADAKPTRPPALLSYGDGKADGKKSYGGSGHMIRFELPEGVTSVRGLRIHGSRYGLCKRRMRTSKSRS